MDLWFRLLFIATFGLVFAGLGIVLHAVASEEQSTGIGITAALRVAHGLLRLRGGHDHGSELSDIDLLVRELANLMIEQSYVDPVERGLHCAASYG
ncbi:MAG: hypothetical protein ABL904_12165 [Hyphomicrobiaceae bacterium]